MAQENVFLDLRHITVRYLDQILLDNFSFTIKQDEQWAITGPSGSGKTVLLDAIAGKYNIVNGHISYPFFEAFLQSHRITDPLFNYRHLIATVARQHDFRNRANMRDFYYQQRFQAFDSNEAPTVREVLEREINAAHEHVQKAENKFSPEEIIQLLRLGSLLDKELIKLSNGETRRLLIAQALLKQPALLLLDNPLTGLDVQSRQFFHALLSRIVDAGIHILLVTTAHEIPDCITHVLALDQRQVKGRYRRKDFIQQTVTLPEEKKWHPDSKLLRELEQTEHAPGLSFRKALHMEDIHVQYGDSIILQHINWTVNRGEKWALLGHNGAGKSTLLSLITGDHPQAYANRIHLFDKKRGSGESIWELKKKIGFVSPELHQYFRSENTCLNMVLSGFFDALVLSKKPSDEQVSTAGKWLRLLDMEQLADKKFRHVSSGEQRLILLVRALVKDPPLLILDEPCQGLDDEQKDHFRKVVETICDHPDKTMIYVTHYAEEIPDCVTSVLELAGGRIQYQGKYPR